MAHDVFISYSSKDKAVADAVRARLEAGVPYVEAIIDPIHGAKVMVLVFPRTPTGAATFRKKWSGQ